MQKQMIVLYLDTESKLEPINKKIGKSTTYTQYHEMSCFCLYPVSIYEEREPILYLGKNCAQVCLRAIEKEVERAAEIFSLYQPLIISKEQRARLMAVSKICCICNKELDKKKGNSP